jgi:MFS family permease
VLGCLASPRRLAGVVAQSASSQLMQGVTGWITDAASWFLAHVQQLLVGATEPDLTASWWVDRYRLLLAFAALVAAATLLIAIANAAVQGSWEGLAVALGVDVPVAALSGGVAPVLVGYLIQVANWLSTRLLESFGHDGVTALRTTATWFGTFGQAGGPTMPLFLGALLALIAIVGGLLVTLELILRANAIYLVTALIPVMYALRVWPALRPLARRTVEALVAVIMAQPIVALAIAIGVHAGSDLGVPGAQPVGEFARALTGTVMLLLAALAPWAILHLLPVVEAGMVAQRQRAAVGAGPRAAIQSVYVGSYLGRMTQPASRRAGRAVQAQGNGNSGGWQLARAAADAQAHRERDDRSPRPLSPPRSSRDREDGR